MIPLESRNTNCLNRELCVTEEKRQIKTNKITSKSYNYYEGCQSYDHQLLTSRRLIFLRQQCLCMCWLFGCQIYNFMGLLTFQHYHLDEDKKVGISLLPTPFLCSFSPSHFGIIPISYLRQSHSFLRHVCMTLYSGSHTGFANNCFFH